MSTIMQVIVGMLVGGAIGYLNAKVTNWAWDRWPWRTWGTHFAIGWCTAIFIGIQWSFWLGAALLLWVLVTAIAPVGRLVEQDYANLRN